MSTFSQARKDIRFLASSLRGLVALDAQLGEAGDLEKVIAGLKAEQSTLEGQRVSMLAAIDEANKTASDIVQKAQDQAASIEAGAAHVKANAEQRALTVTALIADAQRQAAALVEQGTADAAQARQDASGKLGELRKAIATAQAQLTYKLDEVTAAEAKKAAAEAALDGLRKKLG